MVKLLIYHQIHVFASQIITGMEQSASYVPMVKYGTQQFYNAPALKERTGMVIVVLAVLQHKSGQLQQMHAPALQTKIGMASTVFNAMVVAVGFRH